MIRFLRTLGPAISLLFCLGAFWFLDRQLEHYHYRDIRAGLEAVPAWSVWLAMALAAVNYLVMVGYDRLALGYLGHPLPLRKIALASFVGYAVAHNFGSLFGGTAIRYRLYSAFGLSAVEAVKAIVVCAATFWIGFFTLSGLVFLFEPPALPAALRLPFDTARPVGLGCLALVAGYLLASAFRKSPVKLGEWEFSLPPLRLSLCQIAIASVDLAIAASVVYVLLPNSVPMGFPAFLGVYLVTQVAALVTHVPGGLGIFEALMLLLLAPAEPQAVIGSLLLFRAIYYLLPLGLASVLLGVHEAFEQRESLRRFADALGQWGPDLAPGVFASAVFVAGAILLVSGALPPAHARLAWLGTVLPVPVLEASHFLGSLAGAGLLLLAQGLYRRLDAAYVLTAVLLAGGSVLSLLKGLDYGEALILAVLLAALLPCRRSFERHAALIGDRFTSGWNLAAVMVLVSAIWLGFFSYKHVEYSSELWWRFTLRDDAPRFLRAMVGASAVMLLAAAARLFRPAASRPPDSDRQD
jgi:phosphatidylglycerol lysyltransferase